MSMNSRPYFVVGISPNGDYFHHETIAINGSEAIERIVGFYEVTCFPPGTHWMSAMITTKPDASLHNPDPRYLRGLLDRAGMTQRQAAKLIGISDRVMRYYLSDVSSEGYRAAPYTVQFSLECLVRERRRTTAF